MGGAVFPPCGLALGQTMVAVMVVMGPPSKELIPAHWAPRTFVISAPDPAAGHLSMRTSTGDSQTQASLAQSLMGSLLLSPGEGNDTPLHYSCLENPMDGEAWWAAVHGVAKSQTRLSDFTFTFHCHALEKEMATHSSVLAGRIPGTGEPGGLPSMGSHRVGHDWSDLAAAAAAPFSWVLVCTRFCCALQESVFLGF